MATEETDSSKTYLSVGSVVGLCRKRKKIQCTKTESRCDKNELATPNRRDDWSYAAPDCQQRRLSTFDKIINNNTILISTQRHQRCTQTRKHAHFLPQIEQLNSFDSTNRAGKPIIIISNNNQYIFLTTDVRIRTPAPPILRTATTATLPSCCVASAATTDDRTSRLFRVLYIYICCYFCLRERNETHCATNTRWPCAKTGGAPSGTKRNENEPWEDWWSSK